MRGVASFLVSDLPVRWVDYIQLQCVTEIMTVLSGFFSLFD